ncbi:MAG: hypothetical protein Q8Q88_19905 [Phenylobacterium sp.]|uniref:hypothetical protein n=1 Tax=Phenylobacterium sp. TaxID=1871053 RepID=UPI002732D89C|nr:hypothetical protein [Phenylobacterium sp.]MDP3749307.1 hypothetical protein [Phenylobacterium sp.]
MDRDKDVIARWNKPLILAITLVGVGILVVGLFPVLAYSGLGVFAARPRSGGDDLVGAVGALICGGTTVALNLPKLLGSGVAILRRGDRLYVDGSLRRDVRLGDISDASVETVRTSRGSRKRFSLLLRDGSTIRLPAWHVKERPEEVLLGLQALLASRPSQD